MVEKLVEIKNRTGIHARPASLIVQKANQFESDILILKEREEASAKSIMGIMSLGISQSTKINIRAEGSDEEEAVKELVDLIKSNIDK